MTKPNLLKRLINDPLLGKEPFKEFSLQKPGKSSATSRWHQQSNTFKNDLERQTLLFEIPKAHALSSLRVPTFPVKVSINQDWYRNVLPNLILRAPVHSSVELQIPKFIIEPNASPPLSDFILNDFHFGAFEKRTFTVDSSSTYDALSDRLRSLSNTLSCEAYQKYQRQLLADVSYTEFAIRIGLFQSLLHQSFEVLHLTDTSLFLNVGVIIPSTDLVATSLALQSLNVQCVPLPVHEALAPKPQDIVRLWKRMLVESKAKLCLSCIDMADSLRPLAQLLSIPQLVVLPGCSGLISYARLMELRKSGPKAFERFLVKEYARFRVNCGNFIEKTQQLLDNSRIEFNSQKHYCRLKNFKMNQLPNRGIYLFSDGLLPRGAPKPYFIDSNTLSIHAQRAIRCLKLEPSDHLFSCLPLGHPGMVIDAMQGCLESGAQLTVSQIFKAHDTYDLPSLIWEKLVDKSQSDRPITILQVTDYQARYLYNALWSPDVTEQDRSRYRHAASQLKRLLVYKTNTELDDYLRPKGMFGMPKTIVKRIQRRLKFKRKRKEDLETGKCLFPEYQLEQEERERKERLERRIATVKLLEKWSLLIHPDGQINIVLSTPQIGSVLISKISSSPSLITEFEEGFNTQNVFTAEKETDQNVLSQRRKKHIIWTAMEGINFGYSKARRELYVRLDPQNNRQTPPIKQLNQCPANTINTGIPLAYTITPISKEVRLSIENGIVWLPSASEIKISGTIYNASKPKLTEKTLLFWRRRALSTIGSDGMRRKSKKMPGIPVDCTPKLRLGPKAWKCFHKKKKHWPMWI